MLPYANDARNDFGEEILMDNETWFELLKKAEWDFEKRRWMFAVVLHSARVV